MNEVRARIWTRVLFHGPMPAHAVYPAKVGGCRNGLGYVIKNKFRMTYPGGPGGEVDQDVSA